MIQNQKACIIFRLACCTLGVLGFLAQTGLLYGTLNRNYLVYYTNLSNLICTAFFFCELWHICPGRKGCGSFAPAAKFVFVIMISITFILYNGLLAHYPSVLAYFSSLKNALNHCILPLLFVLDWLVFYERGRTKLHWPLLAIFPPLSYVVGILIRAAVLDALGRSAAVVYPYYFLDLQTLGWGGFLRWMGILLAGFLALGYFLCLLDQLTAKRT